MLMFIKLGGSVITDKTRPETPDAAMIAQLAAELAAALRADPALRVVLGHGSGSYGHSYARRYGVHSGIAPEADYTGFALTAAAALRLSRIVVDALLDAGVPALSLQPSSTLLAERGALVRWDTANLEVALARRLVPVIHGDVAFDSAQGSAIISTEQLLVWLADQVALRPDRVVLVGERGVFTADPRLDPQAALIRRITPANVQQVLAGTGGSHGVDVTGGMRAKVELIWRLVQAHPGLAAELIGTAPGLLEQTLRAPGSAEGTTISGTEN